MFTGPEISSTLAQLGVTDVVWLPDSVLGRWESALEDSSQLRLTRVCREGEAWPLAAGLLLGGNRPVVVMQTTGLFESGDALRNVLFDLELPLLAIIGARSWTVKDSRDSAKRFARPVLDAWSVPYKLLETSDDKPQLAEFFAAAIEARRPAFAVLAEGKR